MSSDDESIKDDDVPTFDEILKTLENMELTEDQIQQIQMAIGQGCSYFDENEWQQCSEKPEEIKESCDHCHNNIFCGQHKIDTCPICKDRICYGCRNPRERYDIVEYWCEDCYKIGSSLHKKYMSEKAFLESNPTESELKFRDDINRSNYFLAKDQLKHFLSYRKLFLWC